MGILDDIEDALYDAGGAVKSGARSAWRGTKKVARGAVSVGKDIYHGADRTIEGLNFFDQDRQVEIAVENEMVVKLVTNTFKSAVGAASNPLTQLAGAILGAYMITVPDDVIEEMAKDAGVSYAPTAVGKYLGKLVAAKITERVLRRVVKTKLFKMLAKKIGISAGAAATGVGAPISLLMWQGMAQKASKASRRLKKIDPKLHRELRRKGGLDMLYFIAEKQLKPYVHGVAMARKNPKVFEFMLRALSAIDDAEKAKLEAAH